MSTEVIDPPAVDPAPPPAETPWHASIFTPDKPGELIPDWHTKAPEPKAFEAYRGAKNFEEALTMADARVKEAQTALRNKKDTDAGLPVRPEGDAATPEAWAEYYEKRGLPKDPTGYGLKKPDGYPDALWNDAESADYAKFFHENDVSPELVKKIAEFTQARGLVAYANYQQQQAAMAAELETKKKAYVQSEQETLVGMFGQRVDPVLKSLEKLTSIAGLDPAHLDPKNPEMWVGANVVKAMESLVSMIPKTGDPTRRDMGPGQQGNIKDVSYWKNLPNDHPDRKAFENSADPRHKQVTAERNAAYALAAELGQK